MIRSEIMFITISTLLGAISNQVLAEDGRPYVKIRGIYGGVPIELLEEGTLEQHGVNAIFMGSRGINEERLELLKQQGAKVFAEFNTMHVAGYLKDHPDAAPIAASHRVNEVDNGAARLDRFEERLPSPNVRIDIQEVLSSST